MHYLFKNDTIFYKISKTPTRVSAYRYMKLLLLWLFYCVLSACLTTRTILFWLEYRQMWGQGRQNTHKRDTTAPIQPVNNSHNVPSTYEPTWVAGPSLWWQGPAASPDPASARPLSRPPWGRTESACHTTWCAQTPGSFPVNVNVITKLQHGPECCEHVTLHSLNLKDSLY